MMGRQKADQSQPFHLIDLEGRIPAHHLLRRIYPTMTRLFASLRERLEAFYGEIGLPSIDPEADDPDVDTRPAPFDITIGAVVVLPAAESV